MLFLYEKQYPTYFKINPFKHNGNAINYLLNKLFSNTHNLKIGAQGISLIHKIFLNNQNNHDITNKLQKWISNLKSIAFIANDINTINSFLLQYKPKLIYLSIDSIRYNSTSNGIGYHHHPPHGIGVGAGPGVGVGVGVATTAIPHHQYYLMNSKKDMMHHNQHQLLLHQPHYH